VEPTTGELYARPARPLDESASQRLIDNLLVEADLPNQARGRIAEAAGGNPLFVEEMLRMLVDDGLLQRRNGGWVVTSDLTQVSIPPTIHALLSARLDRLGPQEREVLGCGSVVGQVFWWGSVSALAEGVPHAAVASHLQDLVQKELLRPDLSSFTEDDAFRFTHILIRDAAYKALPKSLRAELHARFAEWLERKVGERISEYEEILGYHLEHAYRLRRDLGYGDEAAHALASRAADRLAAAGRRAFRRGDVTAASKLLARAAELLPPGNAKRIEHLLMMGSALAQIGALSSADQTFTKVVEEAVIVGDHRLEQYALIERAGLRTWIGDTEADLDSAVASAIQTFSDVSDDKGLARAYKWQAEVYNERGLMGERAQALERALNHARAAQDTALELDILSYLPAAIAQSPVPVEEGIHRCNQLLREMTTRSRAAEASILGSLASLYANQGKFDEARRLVQASRATFEELDLRWELARFTQNMGEVELLAGDPAAAERVLREGCAIFAEMGERGRRAFLLTLVAEALYRQGAYTEAEAAARESILDEGDESATSVLAKILALKDDPAAESLAREAVESLRRLEVPDSYAKALMDLAHVLRRTDLPTAVTTAEEAARVCKRRGNIALANEVHTLVGELTRELSETGSGGP
jgi:predicted ATPase